MARRLVDAAKAARQLTAWSDLKDNISDDGSSDVSEDSEAGDDDDETNKNMSDPSPVNSPGARTSGEDEMSDSNEGESDNDDSTESSDTVTQSTFRGRNGQVWAATCPPPSRTRACNIRHTREGPVGNTKDIENEVDAFTCFIDKDMLKQVVKHTNNRAKRDLRAKGKNPDEWAPVNLCEIRGIVRLLYLIGVYRSQHERFAHMVHSEGLYFLLLSAVIALNSLQQTYGLTVMKIATHMTSLLHFDVCGNSLLKIVENVML